MKLTNEQLAFLEAAVLKDDVRPSLNAIWSMPNFKALISVNGFVLHAIKSIHENTFAFRLIKIDEQREFVLSDLKESNAPNFAIAIQGKQIAKMRINPNLLLKSLIEICKGGSLWVDLSIREDGNGSNQRLEIRGYSNNDPYYALIMGMYHNGLDKDLWSPFEGDHQ